MKVIGYVLYGVYVLSTLWLLVNAIVQLHLMWHANKKKQANETKLKNLPFVSVQVPVYNEKYVIEGLLNALASLDYPKELYEIQVLDDSTDETSSIINRLANDLDRQEINISVIRRDTREGYKAGALQYGLSLCKGDFIAIFDADFRPTTNF